MTTEFASSAFQFDYPATTAGTNTSTGQSSFCPQQPTSLADACLESRELSPLVLKFLFMHGWHSGGAISRQLKLPFPLIEPILQSMRSDQLIGHKSSAPGNDYVYEISPKGAEQARLAIEHSTYCGSAPVSIEQYANAVMRQSLRNFKIKVQNVIDALGDLVVSKLLIGQLGQAVNSGKSMLLYGPTGNGKTSIARRLLLSAASTMWIPRALAVGTEVIRVFDPAVHRESPLNDEQSVVRGAQVDQRWVRIQRPIIAVGGELRMDHLEATFNPMTRIIEAPIHIKSNGGCLIVDDFGRQKVSMVELLNRWIVPMDSGMDFINLPSGRQIKLPFDQLLIYSTNLTPQQVCDEAFLRRIPYKIEIFDPTEQQFRNLFELRSQQFGFDLQPGILDYLIEYHFKRTNRQLRFCFVEDLLNQAKDYCSFHDKPLVFNRDIAEMAVLNYFSRL